MTRPILLIGGGKGGVGKSLLSMTIVDFLSCTDCAPFLHKCRRAGCRHVEAASDDALRGCPRCRMKLWPSGQVRPIRFHHLRHTTASLLLMRGADVAAVQRILRHSDPRLTTETYGHLVPDYLRAQIDRRPSG